MKIAILAAGVGSRLRPLTDDRPKAMVEVDGKPILQYQIDAIKECGFSPEQIFIITGYKDGVIRKYLENESVNFIHNEKYDTINNIYSLKLTEKIDDDIILINSDDIFHPDILRKVIDSKHSTCLAVDDSKVLGEEEMKIKIEKGVLSEINKTMEPTSAIGEYIGISRLSLNDLKIVYNHIDVMLNKGLTNCWYEDAYYQSIGDVDFHFESTKGLPWIEIDDHDDLKKASYVVKSIKKEV